MIRVVKNRYKPLLCIENKVLCSHNTSIYMLEPQSGEIEYVQSLSISKVKGILGKIRLMERFLRIEPRYAINIGERNIFVLCKNRVFHIDLYAKKILQEHHIRLNRSALMLAKIENINGFSDSIVYGEYFSNKKRESVAIVAYRNGKWSSLYEFENGSVRHVHGIYPDKKNERVLILTGDSDDESGIWQTRDNFKTIVPLLVGKQIYRSCYLLTRNEQIIFPTDTPMQTNYICKFIEDKGTFDAVIELEGSCIYAKETANGMLVSTAVEPHENISGTFRKLINYKIGSGIKSLFCEINNVYVSDDALKNDVILRLKKDIFSMTIFQYGTVFFANGNINGKIYAYPIAVKSYDGKMIEIDI